MNQQNRPAEPPANPFKPAVRQQVLGRIALEGLSKKGKTLAALAMARGLVGPDGIVAMLDCDNGSAKLYAGTPALATEKQPTGFEHANLGKPYHPSRFITVLDSCAAWGVDCLIIDTITAEWSGEGGIQQIVDDRKRAKQGTGWDVGTPLHQAFLRAIVQCKAHVIATVRQKSDTQIDRDERGNLTVRKLGLKPDQRDQFDYEFTIVGTIQENHEMVLEGRGGFAARLIPAHPDTGDIDGIAKQYVKLGEEISAWLNSGARVEAAERTPSPAPSASPAAAAAPATTPENPPSGDDEPPAGSGDADGEGSAGFVPDDDGSAGLVPDEPVPARNGAAPMSEEQATGLIQQLHILSELRGDLDWGERINVKGKARWGDAFADWNSATAEQAVTLASIMEQAIRQLRERAAVQAQS